MKNRTIPGWTREEILAAAEEQMFGAANNGCGGICINCGDVRDAEPDARAYRCFTCGKWAVFGCSELVLMGYAE